MTEQKAVFEGFDLDEQPKRSLEYKQFSGQNMTDAGMFLKAFQPLSTCWAIHMQEGTICLRLHDFEDRDIEAHERPLRGIVQDGDFVVRDVETGVYTACSASLFKMIRGAHEFEPMDN